MPLTLSRLVMPICIVKMPVCIMKTAKMIINMHDASPAHVEFVFGSINKKVQCLSFLIKTIVDISQVKETI